MSFVIERASKQGMTASDIFNNLAVDHREYVEAGKISRQQVLITLVDLSASSESRSKT